MIKSLVCMLTFWNNFSLFSWLFLPWHFQVTKRPYFILNMHQSYFIIWSLEKILIENLFLMWKIHKWVSNPDATWLMNHKTIKFGQIFQVAVKNQTFPCVSAGQQLCFFFAIDITVYFRHENLLSGLTGFEYVFPKLIYC